MATSGTVGYILSHDIASTKERNRLEAIYSKLTALSQKSTTSYRSPFFIELYIPSIAPRARWLSAVEQRIRNATYPTEYGRPETTEWLSEGAALSAIEFLRSNADLLPTEPFIYATKNGDFVAEFETENMNLTTVIGPREAIFFLSNAGDRENPVYIVVGHETKEMKGALMEISKRSHGQMAAKSG